MTIAISEILQQAELLSPVEQLELVTELSARVRQRAEAALLDNAGENAGEPGEEWLNLSKVERLPLHQTVTRLIRVRYEGRGKPMPYDFSDYLWEDEEESSE